MWEPGRVVWLLPTNPVLPCCLCVCSLPARILPSLPRDQALPQVPPEQLVQCYRGHSLSLQPGLLPGTHRESKCCLYS